VSSKRIFVQETNAHNGHYIAGFDSIVYSQHHIGHIQGAARRIPAIMSESATDAMLWQVVNLKRDNGMFDSIAVLGAVDDQEAADWAMSQYGRMFDSVVVSTAETSAPGLMRHLDNPKLHSYTSHLKPKDLARMQDMTTSEAVMWDGLELLSHDGTSLSLLLDMTKVDDDGLMLDSMTLDELKALAMGDDGEVEGYDSLIVQNNQMQKLMDRLSSAMSKATSAGGITVSTVSQSEPFKKNKVTQVAAMFDLSDGQSVSIIFHNPDSTPAKLLPSDTLISWKFLLNKRDISAAVQPNQGEDVQLPVLAGRIMKLVHANSARFKRTNAKKDENLKALADVEQLINDKNQQVMDLDAEIADLQAKIDAGVVMRPPAPVPEPKTPPIGYSGVWDTEDGSAHPFLSVRPEGIASFATRAEAEQHYAEHTRQVEPTLTKTDMGNGESLVKGMAENPDGTFTALTLVDSKTFKTRAGAVRWLAQRGLNPDGSKIGGGAPDLEYRTNGLFTSFVPNTPEGEQAWREMAVSMQAAWKEAFPDLDVATDAKIPTAHLQQVIKSLENAGYNVAQAAAPIKSTPEEDDALLANLGLNQVQEQIVPATNPDAQYLQSIVDGKSDLSVAGDELERIGDNLPPELEALFEQAAEAYAQYAIALEV
jgi:hypothetical protein